MEERRVPVTLLTGFLGAGKTTLLNAVLADSSTGRVAVIVNEFGEAGLDHDLIEESSDEVILMQSGCLCCSVRGDLSRTILSLVKRRASGTLAFDRIVIETTGLADPGPILQTLVGDEFLGRSTVTDGVVTVVDAAHGMSTLDAQFEAVSQAASADLIILSKTDLVTPGERAKLEARLRGLNPSAPIVQAEKGAGAAALIWGLSGVRRGVNPDQALTWMHLAETTPPADPLGNLSGLFATSPKGSAQNPAALAPASPHDARIGSASIVVDEPLKDEVFDQWLNTLVSMRGPNLLRVKGLVFLEGIEAPFVFHGVQHIFDGPLPVQNWDREDRQSRIVVIARDLSESKLRRSLKMLQEQS